MTRLCERPGCSAPAEVAYGFDADARAVWLDSFSVAVEARSGVLCRRHADAMVVPVGWSLDDRRDPIPRLFRPAVTAPGAPVPPVPRRKSVRSDDSRQLRLDETLDDEPPSAHPTEGVPGLDAAAEAIDAIDDVAPALGVDEADADDEGTAPWVPQFDQADDLSGLLSARGPLLSRAFGVQQRPSDP